MKFEQNNMQKKQLRFKEFIKELSNNDDEITFSQQEVENFKNEAYAKGFAEGIDLGVSQGELKSLREVDNCLKEILSQINQKIQTFIDYEKQFHEHFFKNILRICKTVLHKTMPYFYKKNGAKEMEDILHTVIHSMITHTPIRIFISERIYQNLGECVGDLCSKYPETIEILKRSNISDGVCEIEWLGGGAKWNSQQSYKKIEEKINEYIDKEQFSGDFK